MQGIPISSGMGGSAASAVGAVVAANELLPEPLSKEELLRFALSGEYVASHAYHADEITINKEPRDCQQTQQSLITHNYKIQIT